MAGQITYTQERLESLILAEPYFSDIEVVRFDKGDIQNMIDIAIAKIGICVLILTPKMTVRFKDMPGPFWEINSTCEIIELVPVNRGSTGTGKAASEVADYLAAAVHQKAQPGDNVFAHVSTELTGIGKDEARNQTLITYAVDFLTEGGVNLDVNQAATPGLSNAAGTITLTCATVGATIFYTTNGKTPGPQTTGATRYTVPFSVSSGTTVKARAWIWGYTVSQQTTYTA